MYKIINIILLLLGIFLTVYTLLTYLNGNLYELIDFLGRVPMMILGTIFTVISLNNLLNSLKEK